MGRCSTASCVSLFPTRTIFLLDCINRHGPTTGLDNERLEDGDGAPVLLSANLIVK